MESPLTTVRSLSTMKYVLYDSSWFSKLPSKISYPVRMSRNEDIPTNRMMDAILSSWISFLIISGNTQSPSSKTKKALVAKKLLYLPPKKSCEDRLFMMSPNTMK